MSSYFSTTHLFSVTYEFVLSLVEKSPFRDTECAFRTLEWPFRITEWRFCITERRFFLWFDDFSCLYGFCSLSKKRKRAYQ